MPLFDVSPSPIHTDQLYAPYAMNWVTFHSIVDPDQCQLHGDRSSGGNYVDVSLRVVVKCATDTVMVSLSLIATSHPICADNWCDRVCNHASSMVQPLLERVSADKELQSIFQNTSKKHLMRRLQLKVM
jgi:hypothetical protein